MRAAAPHPSVHCWHTAPTAWQLGKPWKGKGATEAPGSCYTSQRLQIGSVRQRSKSRDCQLPCCAETCQPAEGWCLALCRDWKPVGKGKRGDSSIFPWIAKWVQLSHEPFYLSWAHHKKVFHFANLYICIAEHKPPLWEMTTGHKQHYMSQGLHLQQQTEIGQIMYPIAGTWASVLFNYICAYWHGFGLCQLSQAVSGRVSGLGIFYNRHYWWGYFILGGR